MKKFITLILLFTTLLTSAQNDVLVVYIDASESGNSLIQIQNDVNDLVNSKPNSEIYLFISKGESPIVTNDRGDVAKQLRKLRMETITSPDYKEDVESLNAAMLENNFFSNINNISSSNGLNKQFEIHFWLNERDYTSLDLDKKIVDPFLFSNKLKFKDKIQENCSAILHLSNDETKITNVKTYE